MSLLTYATAGLALTTLATGGWAWWQGERLEATQLRLSAAETTIATQKEVLEAERRATAATAAHVARVERTTAELGTLAQMIQTAGGRQDGCEPSPASRAFLREYRRLHAAD
ncbi:MAG: hypothetical protein AAFW69_07325 [Pseudomonadota bacterium]